MSQAMLLLPAAVTHSSDFFQQSSVLLHEIVRPFLFAQCLHQLTIQNMNLGNRLANTLLQEKGYVGKPPQPMVMAWESDLYPSHTGAKIQYSLGEGGPHHTRSIF